MRAKKTIFSGIAVTGLLAGSMMAGSASAEAAKRRIPPPCSGYYGLSFDDGPSPMTPQYLDALRRANVKASFFVNGSKITAYPGNVQKMASAGHQVGNHTEDHADLTTLDTAGVNAEIDSVTAKLAAVGVSTNLLRPPYGASNWSIRQQIEAKGLLQALWSVDTKDWEATATVNSIVNKATQVTNGGIILMHEDKSKTLTAIPKIVDQLRTKGLCPGKIVKSDTERPTDVPSLTMNVMAVKP